MKLTTGTSSKIRELYEAVKREQEGNGESPEETITCESALREAGVDETLIAKKLKEQLEAKQPRWNPKKKGFDLFPDHDARLAALREIVEILRGYSSPDGNRDRAPVIIDLTNSWMSRPRGSGHGHDQPEPRTSSENARGGGMYPGPPRS